MHESDAVAVGGAEQGDQAGEFEEGVAFGAAGRAELQRGRILEEDQHGDLALLDELLAVGFAEAGGDVPVDVAHVVAELVLHDLVELHATAAEGGAVFAAQHRLDRVPDPPLEAPQRREVGGPRGDG